MKENLVERHDVFPRTPTCNNNFDCSIIATRISLFISSHVLLDENVGYASDSPLFLLILTAKRSHCFSTQESKHHNKLWFFFRVLATFCLLCHELKKIDYSSREGT